MYFVSGNNLFKQWFFPDTIFPEFRTIVSKTDSSFDIHDAKLVQVNWSYNIYLLAGTFHLLGNGSEKLEKVKLPKECDDTQLSTNYILVGNDYNLILASKNTNTLWISTLAQNNEFKKINLNVEAPVGSTNKRTKINDEISKIDVTNESCLFLTREGKVYSGLLPSFIDTENCLGKICDIECGYEHNLILTDAGRVYTWGNGRRLQLGHGDVSNLESPTEVEALAGIKITKIKAGGWHSMALSEFGDLYAWGWNETGQLGIKDLSGMNSCSVPTLIDLFNNDEVVNLNVKDIACGSRHSAILLEDNSVWTTGFNKYGQLGLSPDVYPSVNYFRKVFQCEGEATLICGPWTTVVECKKTK